MKTQTKNTTKTTSIRAAAVAATIAAGIALTTAAPASAQPLTETFTYQGLLRDNGELANGAYDFNYRVFDAEVGGNVVAPVEVLSNQAVIDGLFTAPLEFGANVFTGDRRWLEVAVRPAGGGAFTTLPRREITATPNAIFSKSSEVAGFAAQSGTTLQQAFDNGRAIDFGANLLSMSNSVGGGLLKLGIGDGFGNDVIQVYSPDDEQILYLAEDAEEGGFLFVPGAPGGNGGFRVDGNVFGTGSTEVSIFGTNSVVFATDLSNDSSVFLPRNAIASDEIADEPGIAAETVNASTVALTSTTASIDSRTITTPAAGFVVAIATVEVFVDHVSGFGTRFELGLATAPGVFQDQQEYSVEVEASVGTDSLLSRTVTIHQVFQLPAGTHTIHINGRQSLGAGTGTDTSDITLSTLFFPTAYGLVQRTPEPRLPGVDDETAIANGLAAMQADPAAEREASIAANLARMQAEMDAMRAEIETMRAERGKNTPRTNR